VTGQTISHYRIAEKLGEGGTAVVYSAEDLLLGREVVLKFLPDDDARSSVRFQHEARTISSLNHPNICTVYEIGEHEGRQFLAMERVDGQPLSDLIPAQGMVIDHLLDIGSQIAEGLDSAHAEGVVHRDLKPGNVCVTRGGRVKLLDFGIALVLPRGRNPISSQSSGLPRVGTIPYMSPEQVRGEALDARTDLFSLGIVLYEMAAGRRPFVGATSDDVLVAIATRTPEPLRAVKPALPVEFERIVAKALEKSRTLRYQTASDLRADLQRLKRDLDLDLDLSTTGVLPAAVISPAAPTERAVRRASRVWAAAIVGIAAFAGAGLFAYVSVKDRWAQPGGSTTYLESRPLVPAFATLPGAHDRFDSNRPSARRNPDASDPVVSKAPDRDVAPIVMAKRQIDLHLYDQAVDTLRGIMRDDDASLAVQAGFMMASIAEARSDMANAMNVYLEIATRFPHHPRAPEALFDLAQSAMKSKRPNSEQDAHRILTQLASDYPGTSWAPRALLLRGEIEARGGTFERDARSGGSIPTAAATYRQIAERYRTSESALTALHRLAGIYAELKRFETAAATLEELARRDAAGRYDAWFAAAEIYDKRLKDQRRAKAAYARVPPSSPHYSEAVKRH
jgi:serine/threonine protein kinase